MLQAVLSFGKSYLYDSLVNYDESLFEAGDDVLLRFKKNDCKSKLLSAKTEACDDRIRIEVNVQSCFDSYNRWSVEVLRNTEQKEKLSEFDVILYQKKEYK